MQRQLFLLVLLLFTSLSHADFCPCNDKTSFNLIYIGNPLAQILKSCCAPTSQKTYKQETPVPQKWTYNITAPANPVNTTQGSVELIITFDETQKVTNLTVNAQSLASTNCGSAATTSFAVNMPNTVQVGDTMQTVKATCGKPLFIQKGIPQGDPQSTPTITELQFAGPPPVTLIFEDNKLKEIRK